MDQSNQCIEAFKLGKRHKAKELLSYVRDPAAVKIEDVDFASGSKFTAPPTTDGTIWQRCSSRFTD